MFLIKPPQEKKIFETYRPFDDLFITNKGQIVPDHDKIKHLSETYDFILINCSTEHWGSVRDFPLTLRMSELLVEHNCKGFVCLSHDPSDELLHQKIMYFPFYARLAKIWPSKSTNRLTIAQKQRTYFLSNLNYFARDFRIANYLMLLDKSYADRVFLTMHNQQQLNHDYDGHFSLTEEEICRWKHLQRQPTSFSDHYNVFFGLDHPAFSDSYLHLVSESTVKDKLFVTEKTWKPIAACQLFLIWGNSGIIQLIRDMGVDVFDDVIDHSYDVETDHRLRLNKIHHELDRLSELDWQHLNKLTVDRRIENSQKFYKGVFIDPYLQKLSFKLPPGNYYL